MRTFDDKEAKHEISTEAPPPDRPPRPLGIAFGWTAEEPEETAEDAKASQQKAEARRVFMLAAMEVMEAHRMRLVDDPTFGRYPEDITEEELVELQAEIAKYREAAR